MAHQHEAHVVAVDMGYGHERPAHSLKHLAITGEGIVVANNYPGIPARDRQLWKRSREFYETVSRSRSVPVVGKYLFHLVDAFQNIEPFYPRRDLSSPSLQCRQMYAGIHAGLGRHLIEKLSARPVPLLTTFFLVAFMAEEFNYPGDIWCITTDADISRAWAPKNPKKSRIKYLTGNGRCVERLKLYGVREENIFLTGFPLPPSLVGGPESSVLKRKFIQRLCTLDPRGIFRAHHIKSIESHFGQGTCSMEASRRIPTVMFTIGGAGAQAQLALTVMKSLEPRIRRKEIRLHLMLGARPDLGRRFTEAATRAHLGASLGKELVISSYKTRKEYFDGFDKALAVADVLWTKPSELSFYTGLGLPILMAPPLGSQEEFNRLWLEQVGGGIYQGDPRYTNEWLFDWIASGAFARMAWNGYIEAPTHGAYRIENTVFGETMQVEDLPLIV